MAATTLQRALLERLDQTLDVHAYYRWRRTADRWRVDWRKSTSGERVATVVALAFAGLYVAPVMIPGIAVTSIGARLERRRLGRRLDAQLSRARAILVALGGQTPGATFRTSASLSVRADAPATEVAAACARADRLLLIQAAVNVYTRRDPDLVFAGVALVALVADEPLVAFALWSDDQVDRYPVINPFFAEARDAIRARLPQPLSVEHWTWNHGSTEFLKITPA